MMASSDRVPIDEKPGIPAARQNDWAEWESIW